MVVQEQEVQEKGLKAEFAPASQQLEPLPLLSELGSLSSVVKPLLLRRERVHRDD